MATGDLSVARRYATALFGMAEKRSEIDAVTTDLNLVVETVDSSRELQGVLQHPRLPKEKKRAVIEGVFGGKVRPDVVNFLFLLVEKGRCALLTDIHKEFGRRVDEYSGQADAEAVSAVPLSTSQKQALETALAARFGVRVRLATRVDEHILGGLVVRVGDKLIDGSVAARLQSLSEQLKRTKVV